MNSQLVAKAIYDNLKTKVDGLPPYFFQVAESEAKSLVISETDNSYMQRYYGENELYSFSINLIYPRIDHQSQIDLMEKITQNLNIEKLEINTKMYIVRLIYINQKPIPLNCWEAENLVAYDSTSQRYSVEYGLILEREDNNG